jgi:hypothetical protein
MNSKGLNYGLLTLGIIIGGFIVFLSLFKYISGIYIITGLGFVIFTLSRLIYQDLPLGTILEILIFSTTIGMLVAQKLKNKIFGIHFNHPFIILFILYLVYIFLSISNPAMNSKVGWVNEFKRDLALFCFFFLIYLGLNNLKQQYQFSRFLIALCIISGLYGCYQEFFGYAEFEMNYITSSEKRRKLLFMISGVKRKFSLFSDPSSYGITMAATANILLAMIGNVRFSWKTVVYIILMIICLMGLAFSGTRTAYLAFAAGAAFYLLITINKLATRILGIILFLGFGFIMLVPIYSNPTLNRIKSAFDLDSEASLNVRDVNRKSIQPYLHSHPFGGGPGTTSGSGMKYNPNHVLAGFETDSGYLKIATELGWIALLLLLLQYFLIIKEGLVIYFSTNKKEIKILILGCLVCVFTFIIAQYAQVAVGQFPDSFLFFGAAAIIMKTSFNFRQNKTT